MSSASRPETALENSPLDNHFERVGEDVACGGGAMFKAREKSSGKVVGIQRPPSDPAAIERFVAAAVRVKRLWHTHLLRHYVVAKDDHGPYCAFEWCDGGSVQSKLAAGPLSETEVWALARAVASALEYAHQQGIAHLNVRPSSILVAQTLNYKLGGFGEFSIGAPQDHEHDDVYAPGTIGNDSAALERRDIVDLGLTLLHVATAKAPRPGVMDELLAQQKPNLADFVQRCVDRARGDAFKSIEEAMRSIRENTSGGTEVAGTGRRNAPSPGTRGMRKLLSPERPLGMSGRIPLDGPTAPMPGARPNDDATVRGRSSATRGTNPTAGATPVTGSGGAGSARRGGSGSPLPFESMTERYEEIGDRLEGGMGYVMKCRETSTGRIVAVKRVKSIPGQDEMLVQRFLREANNIARLSHPHVLTLFRAARDEEGDYIVLEWADGGSLKDRLNMAGKLPLNEVLDVARKIGGALGYAHSKGVIHRDIKPHNILLMEDGTPKLADFGLARGTGDMTITRSTGGAGTPIYMAPEQWISARDADGRSDLCSFGKVLYHLSTGQSPVKFIPSKLPLELRSTISILVKDRREDRFQTAEQFLNHMERSLKRVRFLKTLGILLAVLAIVFIVAMFVPAERAPFLKPIQDAVRGLFHK